MPVLTKGALFPCLMLWASALATETADRTHSLDCDSVFLPAVSAAGLSARFGSDNVVPADIPIGEGEFEPGIVLYPNSPRNRVEILWKDPESRRSPRTVGLVGDSSNWVTKFGVTLGMDLKELERLNAAPFILSGFGWDYGGTVTSWSNGSLESAFEACRLLVRLAPELKHIDPPRSGTYEHLTGDRPFRFRSDDPLMQELNPKVYAVTLHY